MGAFDHLEWSYDGAFEQLFGLGRGEFEQKFCKKIQMPGGCPGGGMLKLRFDWYIRLERASEVLELTYLGEYFACVNAN